jgi:hypothetical protein
MTKPIRNTGFVSFNFGEGRGGHYLSMAEVVQSGIFEAPAVIDMGFAPTPPLENLRSEYIEYKFWNAPPSWKRLREAVIRGGVETLFCYDIHAYNIASIALAHAPVRLVWVKCGGPTLTRYFPRPQSLIVFSEEDSRYFEQHLNEVIRATIPNRVSEKRLLAKQIGLANEAEAWLASKPESEKIVCIARISHAYAKKIERAFDYLATCKRVGREATLTIIGYIEHEEVMERLRSRREPDVQVLTDEFHTTDSGRFLSVFDTAITTGRGTIEAVLTGLEVLVPYDKARKLALLSPETFPGLAGTNFSGRASPDDVGAVETHPLPNSSKFAVKERIRKQFSVEASGSSFGAFIASLPSPKPQPMKERFIGQCYLFYCIIRSRSPLLRFLSTRVRKKI